MGRREELSSVDWELEVSLMVENLEEGKEKKLAGEKNT